VRSGRHCAAVAHGLESGHFSFEARRRMATSFVCAGVPVERPGSHTEARGGVVAGVGKADAAVGSSDAAGERSSAPRLGTEPGVCRSVAVNDLLIVLRENARRRGTRKA